MEDFNLARAESIICFEALNSAGDISTAANLLGITREQLVRKMRRYRIQWPASTKEADGGSNAKLHRVLAALLAFGALATACGPHPPMPDATSSSESTDTTENGSGTSLTDIPSNETGFTPTTTGEVETEPESGSGSGTGTGSGSGTGSSSGSDTGDESGGAPACIPIIDMLGTVIGSVCPCEERFCPCLVEEETGICLEPCDGKACPNDLECRSVVIDQQLHALCWPV